MLFMHDLSLLYKKIKWKMILPCSVIFPVAFSFSISLMLNRIYLGRSYKVHPLLMSSECFSSTFWKFDVVSISFFHFTAIELAVVKFYFTVNFYFNIVVLSYLIINSRCIKTFQCICTAHISSFICNIKPTYFKFILPTSWASLSSQSPLIDDTHINIQTQKESCSLGLLLWASSLVRLITPNRTI